MHLNFMVTLLTRISRQTFCTDLYFEEDINLDKLKKSRRPEIVEGFRLRIDHKKRLDIFEFICL